MHLRSLHRARQRVPTEMRRTFADTREMVRLGFFFLLTNFGLALWFRGCQDLISRAELTIQRYTFDAHVTLNATT